MIQGWGFGFGFAFFPLISLLSSSFLAWEHYVLMRLFTYVHFARFPVAAFQGNKDY